MATRIENMEDVLYGKNRDGVTYELLSLKKDLDNFIKKFDNFDKKMWAIIVILVTIAGKEIIALIT